MKLQSNYVTNSSLLVFGFVLCESILRILQLPPLARFGSINTVPGVMEPSPEFGWQNKIGQYFFRGYAGNTFTITNWKNGLRASRLTEQHSGLEVAILGDSFMQGFGLSDEETLPWKIQTRRPEWNVMNYGTGNYGTTQSYLRLGALEDSTSPPAVILYSLNIFHEERNAGIPSWRGNARSSALVGNVFPVPEIKGGQLTVSWLPAVVPWVLAERSNVIALLQETFESLKVFGRMSNSRAMTKRLLTEMKRVAVDSKFIVVIAAGNTASRAEYATFLAAEKIPFELCGESVFGPPDLLLPDGHPSGKANELLAPCYERGIQKVM